LAWVAGYIPISVVTVLDLQEFLDMLNAITTMPHRHLAISTHKTTLFLFLPCFEL